MIWRTSSMPRFDAPSISKTSKQLPLVISAQTLHWLQGVAVGPFSQFSALARMRAAVVLPTPRTPVKRYAWAIRLVRMAFCSVRVIWA